MEEINFPPAVAELLKYVLGVPPVTPRENLAFDSRVVYSDLAFRIRAFRDTINLHVGEAAQALPPGVADPYVQGLSLLTGNNGNGVDYLEMFARYLDDAADGQINISMQIQQAKWEILAECIMFIAEMAMLTALAFFTGGTSLTQAWLLRARTTLSILMIIDRLSRITHIGPSLTEGIQEALILLGVSLAQMGLNPFDRKLKNIDWLNVAKAFAFGAMAGGIISVFSSLGNFFKNVGANFFKGDIGRDLGKFDTKFPDPGSAGKNHFDIRNTPGWLVGLGISGAAEGFGEAVAETLFNGIFENQWTFSWDTVLYGTTSGIIGGVVAGGLVVGALALNAKFFPPKTPPGGVNNSDTFREKMDSGWSGDADRPGADGSRTGSGFGAGSGSKSGAGSGVGSVPPVNVGQFAGSATGDLGTTPPVLTPLPPTAPPISVPTSTVPTSTVPTSNVPTSGGSSANNGFTDRTGRTDGTDASSGSDLSSVPPNRTTPAGLSDSLPVQAAGGLPASALNTVGASRPVLSSGVSPFRPESSFVEADGAQSSGAPNPSGTALTPVSAIRPTTPTQLPAVTPGSIPTSGQTPGLDSTRTQTDPDAEETPADSPADAPADTPAVTPAVAPAHLPGSSATGQTPPGWDSARAQSDPVRRDHTWQEQPDAEADTEPDAEGTTADLPPAVAPGQRGSASFDVRRFVFDGQPVTDLTIEVALAPGDTGATGDTDTAWSDLVSGVDALFNSPAIRLPNGDLLHLTLVPTTTAEATASGPYLTVDLTGPGGITATPAKLARQLAQRAGLDPRDPASVARAIGPVPAAAPAPDPGPAQPTPTTSGATPAASTTEDVPAAVPFEGPQQPRDATAVPTAGSTPPAERAGADLGEPSEIQSYEGAGSPTAPDAPRPVATASPDVPALLDVPDDPDALVTVLTHSSPGPSDPNALSEILDRATPTDQASRPADAQPYEPITPATLTSAAAELQVLYDLYSARYPQVRGRGVNIDAIARNLLHLPPNTPGSEAIRAELFTLVRNAMAQGRAHSIEALVVHHIRTAGAATTGRPLTLNGTQTPGRNWTSDPELDLDITRVVNRPTGKPVTVDNAPWDGVPLTLVSDEGGPKGVRLPWPGGGHRWMNTAEIAEYLVVEAEHLPAGTKILLAWPNAGDLGLELPRLVAHRTGKTVLVNTGPISTDPPPADTATGTTADADATADATTTDATTTDATTTTAPADLRVLTAYSEPGNPVGDWLPVHPDEWRDTDPDSEPEWWEALWATRTIVSPEHEGIGRSSFPPTEPSLENRYNQYRHLLSFDGKFHVDPVTRSLAGRYGPPSKSDYYYYGHGRPGTTSVALIDGRVVTVPMDKFARALVRRPSVSALKDASVAAAARGERPLELYFGPCSADAASMLQLAPGVSWVAAPDTFVLDELDTVPGTQLLANETRMIVDSNGDRVALTITTMAGRYLHGLMTDVLGRQGRSRKRWPEPLLLELAARARKAGLHTGPNQVSLVDLNAALRLTRALRNTLGDAVDTHADHPELLESIGALELMRRADPVLSAAAPRFTMELLVRVVLADRQKRNGTAQSAPLTPQDVRDTLSRALVVRQEAVTAAAAAVAAGRTPDPAPTISTFVSLPLVRKVADEYGNPTEAEVRSVLGLEPHTPLMLTKLHYSQYFWTQVRAEEVYERQPDRDAFEARILHLPQPDPSQSAHARWMVAGALATGRDAYDVNALAAAHLEFEGLLDSSTLITGDGAAGGRNLAGTDLAGKVDLTRWLVPATTPGDQAATAVDTPWQEPLLLVTATALGNGRVGIGKPDGPLYDVSEDEFLELLARNPTIFGKKLDVQVMLGMSKVGELNPDLPGKAMRRFGRTILFTNGTFDLVRDDPRDSARIDTSTPTAEPWQQLSPGDGENPVRTVITNSSADSDPAALNTGGPPAQVAQVVTTLGSADSESEVTRSVDLPGAPAVPAGVHANSSPGPSDPNTLSRILDGATPVAATPAGPAPGTLLTGTPIASAPAPAGSITGTSITSAPPPAGPAPAGPSNSAPAPAGQAPGTRSLIPDPVDAVLAWLWHQDPVHGRRPLDMDTLTRQVMHLPWNAVVQNTDRAELSALVRSAIRLGRDSSLAALGAHHVRTVLATATVTVTVNGGTRDAVNLSSLSGHIAFDQVASQPQGKPPTYGPPPWTGTPLVVLGDLGGAKGVQFPWPTGGRRPMPYEELVEYLVVEAATLPPGEKIVLAWSNSGDLGLDGPELVSKRTNREVISYSGPLRVVRDATTRRRYLTGLDLPGNPLGDWVPTRPTDHRAPDPAYQPQWWEARWRTRTVVDPNYQRHGRSMFQNNEPRVSERQDHHRRFKQFTRWWNLNPATGQFVGAPRPVPQADYYLFAHGGPGIVGVPQTDGSTVQVGQEPFVEAFIRRNSVQALMEESRARVLMGLPRLRLFFGPCFGDALSTLPSSWAMPAAPRPFTLDPLANLSPAQLLSNKTDLTVPNGGIMMNATNSQRQVGAGVFESFTDVQGRLGRDRDRDRQPEPTPARLRVLARTLGLHQDPGPVSPSELDEALRLARALREIFEDEVELRPDYLGLVAKIGALEQMRLADPVLSNAAPHFTLDLLIRVTRAHMNAWGGAPNAPMTSQDVEAALTTMEQVWHTVGNNHSVFADLPATMAVAGRIPAGGPSDDDVRRVLGMRGGTVVTSVHRSMYFWAQVITEEVYAHQPDPAAFEARLLHRPVPAQPDPAESAKARMLVAQAVARGIDPHDLDALAAFYFHDLGFLGLDTWIPVSARVAGGRNFSDTLFPHGIDAAVVKTSATGTSWAPWQNPDGSGRALVVTGEALGNGLLRLRHSGDPQLPPFIMSEEVFVQLLVRDPAVFLQDLGVPLVLAISWLEHHNPALPGKLLTGLGRPVSYTGGVVGWTNLAGPGPARLDATVPGAAIWSQIGYPGVRRIVPSSAVAPDALSWSGFPSASLSAFPSASGPVALDTLGLLTLVEQVVTTVRWAGPGAGAAGLRPTPPLPTEDSATPPPDGPAPDPVHLSDVPARTGRAEAPAALDCLPLLLTFRDALFPQGVRPARSLDESELPRDLTEFALAPGQEWRPAGSWDRVLDSVRAQGAGSVALILARRAGDRAGHAWAAFQPHPTLGQGPDPDPVWIELQAPDGEWLSTPPGLSAADARIVVIDGTGRVVADPAPFTQSSSTEHSLIDLPLSTRRDYGAVG
ncbi:lonely Cys domain-containing protein, partial [Streptomyces mangrovi]